MKVRFLAEAESELDDAVVHYNVKSAGLGVEFAYAVRGAIERIKQRPRAWQLVRPARAALQFEPVSLWARLCAA